jgi:hypothetical protein
MVSDEMARALRLRGFTQVMKGGKATGEWERIMEVK